VSTGFAPPDWTGETVAVVGGGPSLTLEQVRLVGIGRFAGRCKVIAVNSAAFLAWWADWDPPLHLASLRQASPSP
jgi:hypothetical protein